MPLLVGCFLAHHGPDNIEVVAQARTALCQSDISGDGSNGASMLYMNQAIDSLVHKHRELFTRFEDNARDKETGQTLPDSHSRYTIIHEEGDLFPSVIFSRLSSRNNTFRLDPFLRRNKLHSISRISISPDDNSIALIARESPRDTPVVLQISRTTELGRILRVPAYDLSWANDDTLFITALVNQKPQTLYAVSSGGAPHVVLTASSDEEEILLSSDSTNGFLFATITTPSQSSIVGITPTHPLPVVTPLLRHDLPGAICVMWLGNPTCLSYQNDPAGQIIKIKNNKKTLLFSGAPNLPLVDIDVKENELVTFSSTGTSTVIRVIKREKDGSIVASPQINSPGPVTTLSPTRRGGDKHSKTVRKRSFLAPTELLSLEDIRLLSTQTSKEDPPSEYIEESLNIPASGGVYVPVSLVRPRKPRALLVKVYGTYGVSLHAEFTPSLQALLADGVAIAIAHVRGGGELGPSWHELAIGEHKARSTQDFVAATRFLQHHLGLSARSCMASGRSAGGLLVATTAMKVTDLFGAIILDAPLLNLTQALSDPRAPLYGRDLREWGGALIRDLSASHRPIRSLLRLNILVTIPMRDTLIAPAETLQWAVDALCSQQSGYVTLAHGLPTADHLGVRTWLEQEFENSLQHAFIREYVLRPVNHP